MSEAGARGVAPTRRRAPWKTAAYAAIVLVVLVAIDFTLPAILPDSSIRQLLMLAAIYVMVALSLNIINGMAGQFSIGHAGFVGIGAYTSAIVAANLHAASPMTAGSDM